MKQFISGFLLLAGIGGYAQEAAPSHVTISGYAEAYYSYDLSRPLDNTRPSFLYSHNRTGEVNVNLAYLKGSYTSTNVRANITLATGTYMNANYATEPGVLKAIYEANMGVRLSKTRELWLDAGILPSHIGWESAVSKDCPTLTRSLAAENSPYYESGARIGYTNKNGKWYLAALVLNGWQHIQRPAGNTTPAFGTQVTFKPSSAITLNSSTFIGNDRPDSLRQMRYFHDLYGIFQFNSKLAAVLGFDIGAQQQSKGSSKMNTWYTPVIILKYAASPKWALAGRAEYFRDGSGVIISTTNPEGFRTWGFSLNADYSIADNIMWRTEWRNLYSRDDIFISHNSSYQGNNACITTSLAIGF